MKKNIIINLFLLFLLITVTGCFNKKVEDKQLSDAEKFKEEYETLNGQENSNNQKYLEINIDEKNPIKYSSADEIVDVIENKTGIIYLGYPECPWCRNAVPVLLEAAKQIGIDTIYYLNMHDIRDKKSLDDDGNIIIEEEGTEDYKKLLEALGDNASIYEGLNDDSIKRIYVPLVIFVKDGKIIKTHESTVESQEDPYVSLDESQTKELLSIYKDAIHEMLDDLCDSSC
jgi:thiol-disulfide isomerase/thioredoxin